VKELPPAGVLKFNFKSNEEDNVDFSHRKEYAESYMGWHFDEAALAADAAQRKGRWGIKRLVGVMAQWREAFEDSIMRTP